MRSLHRALAVIATLTLFFACGGSEQTQAPKASAKSAPKHQLHEVAAGTCDNLTPPSDAQFPPGFDYPQTAKMMSAWVGTRQGARQRRHAYCVFAGLNQTSGSAGMPVWRTWQTAWKAFPWEYNWPQNGATGGATSRPVTINQARSRASHTAGVILNPIPLYPVRDAVIAKYPQCKTALIGNDGKPIPHKWALIDGQAFQNNGDIMIAAVSYNNAAITNIQNRQLNDAAVLTTKLPSSTTGPSTSIDPMPQSSIVLKVMLWPVAGGGTGTAYTALPVWDWDNNKPGSSSDNQYAGYEIQKFWKRAVAISSGAASGTQQVRFLWGILDPSGFPLPYNTYDAAPVVGLNRFYSKTYTDNDLATLSACDRAILDASAYWTYNREFKSGDSLVLVAMHMMTKEQSTWTFQSAWWHPDAQTCPNNFRFCSGRPLSVPGGDTTWQNYMMSTTYGMIQKTNDPNQHPNISVPSKTHHPPVVWPVAYNPYIELAASHPITTNCMNCHHRAAWPPDTKSKPVDSYPQSAYLQSSPANPNPLEVFQTTNPIFSGQVTVDSMWAVSDRAGYVPGGAKK